MTPKEAIKMLKEDCLSGVFECSMCRLDDTVCYRKVAKEALEKQIPKKPWYQADYDEPDDEYILCHWECPSCGRRLFAKPHHCKCGQAIDWSE